MLSDSEKKFVADAKAFLEHPGLFIRLANVVGKPLEIVENKLPAKIRQMIHKTVQAALTRSLKFAVSTLPSSKDQKGTHNQLHTLGAAVSGGLGGLFGMPSMILELPVTTTLMLRSIAENAREAGFDLSSPEVQLECLYIFSLGTPSSKDDAAETGYYASRLGLSTVLNEASQYLARHSMREVVQALEKGTAPVLIKFIAAVASRFEIAVTEKALSESIPLIGAAGGAAINAAFMRFFSEAAKYHFGLRHLERKYGEQEIRMLYSSSKS